MWATQLKLKDKNPEWIVDNFCKMSSSDGDRHGHDTAKHSRVEVNSISRPTTDRISFSAKKRNVWETVCKEVGAELCELDMVLTKLGLPPHNFLKDQSYPYNDYDTTPNPKTCFSKDYADYHIFPYILPAIQSLIIFARKNRVFQCRNCTFNALDYIAEFLYNNNPLYPERADNPIPLNDIPWAKEWLKRYPRKPYPKWLTMTEDAAARILQRVIRGFLVRKRPDVQEMRQFWRDYKKDMENEKNQNLPQGPQPLYSPYYDAEIYGEYDEREPEKVEQPFGHSDSCFVCKRFRDFLQREELLYQQQALYPASSSVSFQSEFSFGDTERKLVTSQTKIASTERTEMNANERTELN